MSELRRPARGARVAAPARGGDRARPAAPRRGMRASRGCSRRPRRSRRRSGRRRGASGGDGAQQQVATPLGRARGQGRRLTRGITAAKQAPIAPAKRAQLYSAEITLRVKDLSDTTQDALRRTRALGGYVRTCRLRRGRREGTARLVVRVPIGRVQTAILRFSELGTILDQHVSVQDIQPRLDRRFKRIAELRRVIPTLLGRGAGRRAGGAGGAADGAAPRAPAGELRHGVAQPDDEGRRRRADGAGAHRAGVRARRRRARGRGGGNRLRGRRRCALHPARLWLWSSPPGRLAAARTSACSATSASGPVDESAHNCHNSVPGTRTCLN